MLNHLLKPPYVLIGTGSMILFGAGIYEYSIRYSNVTGFHIKDSDPNLRKVEKDVLIPKIMRDLSRTKECAEQVNGFNKCVKQFKPGTFKSYMTFKYCKDENLKMMDCMNEKFTDYEFYLKCKEIYLKDKKFFEFTKVSLKDRVALKEYIVNGQEPEFVLKGDLLNYYNSVKESYENTNDIDSYDNKHMTL